MKKKTMAVLFLLGLLIVAGISPVLNEVASMFTTALDSYEDETPPVNDGGGGGSGWPDGGGGG